MAQMTILTRQDIEGCLKRGMSVPQIATKVGKTPQAITAELKTRRIDSNKGLRRSNAICKWYRECKRTRVCDTNCGMDKWCKNCHQCFLQCPEFEPRTCDRLIYPPFVCNGCENERICPLPKKFYVAKVAQADRDSKLHESRKGVHATNKQIEEMNIAVKNGLGKRQSVRHIIVSNADKFRGLSEKTIYTYVKSGIFDVGRGDLPFACMRRAPKKPAETKTNANYAIADGLKRAFTRFGKWCRKIIDPEPEPTENELLEFLPGFRELFAADLC